MSSDLTFITNQSGQSLLNRFNDLLKEDTRHFDCLVGYFFISGFYRLYPSLEGTEKIRILIGLKTDQTTYALLEEAQNQRELDYTSHAETKGQIATNVLNELESSNDSPDIEQGVRKFIDWIQSGKLEIKAYPSEKIHSKVYIMTFNEGDRDKGRVITGSSNFSQAGLQDNLEFNVELKNRADYDFALNKFNELWADSVDVSEKYVDTIQNKTWLSDTITPHELYLKFLYEHFKEEINRSDNIVHEYLPQGFKKLAYQEQSVLNAKKILDEYGGVFISDVVGLGKTYISAMLANQLDGRNLVIAPPRLLDESNPGSWKNVFYEFQVRQTKFVSIGKLDDIITEGVDQYKNVFIDEAHRFRSETNVTYETLARICRGKRVILVTATPFNNYPRDLLGQIKLFQKGKNSTLPNMRDLDQFFSKLEKNLKGLDRQKDQVDYFRVVRENAKEIRERVLKYLIVRRTRSEVAKYFAEDLKKQGVSFPDVTEPGPIYYVFDAELDDIFMRSLYSIIAVKYARYTPMLHFKDKDKVTADIAQINMGRLMRTLLVKRLESSFHAFKSSLERLIASYEMFIEEYDNGFVYVSKKHSHKIFDYLDDDNDVEIQKLLDADKAQKYSADDFDEKLGEELKQDLSILKEVYKMWQSVDQDPKLDKFCSLLASDKILKDNKLIVFTESKETAEYLEKNLRLRGHKDVIAFTGSSGSSTREVIINNFDAKSKNKQDDYRILIATDVLAEGVNLHRSNTVINYDIPWNPTRMMQRVGRVNRVDTKFDTIHTFNFFPTKQTNDHLKLKEAAEAKIHAFIELLGNDARLLTEGEEIKTHDLFTKLLSKEFISGEDGVDESDLKYLEVIRDIRDNNPDLFTRIKQLPKKARTARNINRKNSALVNFFRKGRLEKYYLSDADTTVELDFITTAKTLEATADEKRVHLEVDFYDYLERSKHEFTLATTEDIETHETVGGTDNAKKVLRILKSNEIKKFQGFTDEDEMFVKKTIRLLEQNALPKQTTKTLNKELGQELEQGARPLKILALIRLYIAPEFFKDTLAESAAQTSGPREIILSEYLAGVKS